MTRIEPKNYATLGFGALLALAGSQPPALHAQSECEDVSGTWAVEITLPTGPNNGTMTLEQTDCVVTGLLEGRYKTPIEDGKVVGWTATFTVQAVNQGSGGTIPMSWEATVEGDVISGTMSNALTGSFDFAGTRASPSRQTG